jgi:hypothetical protein
MDKFEYKGKAEIRHLNVRKEGPDDEKALAVDVKMQCTTSAALLDFFHEGISDVLFTDADAVKNLLLKPLGFANTIMNCDVDILGERYSGVDVGKFSLEPKDGRQVVMTFSVSLQPHGDEVAKLAEFVMDEVDVHIRPQPELNFDVQEKADDSAALGASVPEDELYGKAVEVVRQQNRASISLVQRHLSIGYNRAARLMETMEARGVVSVMNMNGGREVLPA